MSKTVRKTDGKMKRREIRNGTKRRDRVLLIAKERDWVIDLSGRGDRRHINLSL